MDSKNIANIIAELKRFTKTVNACVKRSNENKGWESSSGEMIGIGNFSGTKESGALKRGAMDLKRCLTENV